MRTPNTSCLLCDKPLYRRPADMEKARYAACLVCRSEAQKAAGITIQQQFGLSLGREKGTNHRTGYKHKAVSKAKVALTSRAYWAANPEKAMERGAKIRGEKNYNWKGGITPLAKAIRTTAEYVKWSEAVQVRDGVCVECGASDNLEAHHKEPFAALLAKHGIETIDDARVCAALWNIGNGATLCIAHHLAAHGRTVDHIHQHGTRKIYRCAVCDQAFTRKPSQVANRRTQFCSRRCSGIGMPQQGSANSNWKGGKRQVACRYCDGAFYVKPAIIKRGGGKFCSRSCLRSFQNENPREDLHAAT